MMSAKMAILGLFKIKAFLNKDYDVITYFHDFTNKILSRDLNYIADVVMRPKFGNSSTSMTEVIIISMLKGLNQKNYLLEGWFWFKFNNLGLALGMTRVVRLLKIKDRKFWRLILTFEEVTGKKLVGFFCTSPPPPILNRVKFVLMS